MTKRTIISVVGARPNFMKLAPLARALASRRDLRHVVVHTGQHYDIGMSGAFFRDLGIPDPDLNLEVGSGTHAQQTAAIMQRFEGACLEVQPDVVLVYGDVNSTVAAALVSAKLGLEVGHVEAGLRSRDWSMPEEINRAVTDRLSSLLFTPSRDADDNLIAEGVPEKRIHFVGNIMIDTLVYVLPAARALDAPAQHALAGRPYVVTTLHRPANVDDPAVLTDLFGALTQIARTVPVVFPVHPRTRARLSDLGVAPQTNTDLRLIDPVGYVEVLSLVDGAALVITDSGGLQEETSYLGVPCLTVRPNTERPITVSAGTNRLVPPDGAILEGESRAILSAPRRVDVEIERWDGRTADRIADVLCGRGGATER